MKRSLAVCAFLALLVQAASADTKSDLLALSGGAQVRSVWLVWPWADSSNTPIKARIDDCSEGCRWTQVRVFDTDDGQYRWIDSTCRLHNHPLLNDKDASQVIYEEDDAGKWNVDNCYAGSRVMIRDFKCAQPARQIIKCGAGSKFEGILACSWNPVTDSEYVYVMGAGSMACYRVPLIKPAYTADTAHAYKLPLPLPDCGEQGCIDWALNSSADGLYIGCELPWPMTQFVNSTTAEVHMRHLPGDDAGCNANIAHDNSYRFFYMDPTHTLFRMYGPYSSKDSTQWNVDIVTRLPITPHLAGQDNGYPRWTNNPRFFTVVPPDQAGFGYCDVTHFNLTAQQVKALSPAKPRHMVLGKFSADYKTVEAMALIAGGDVRMENIYGRAWVATGPVSAKPGDLARAHDATRPAISVRGDVARATFAGAGVVSIIDGSGRVVARASGLGSAHCALGNKPAGTYVVNVTTGESRSSATVMISR